MLLAITFRSLNILSTSSAVGTTKIFGFGTGWKGYIDYKKESMVKNEKKRLRKKKLTICEFCS